MMALGLPPPLVEQDRQLQRPVEPKRGAMREVPFGCGYCEGEIVLVIGPGRMHEHRLGVVLELPEDFETAACVGCGCSYLGSEEAERLEPLLQARVAAECRSLARHPEEAKRRVDGRHWKAAAGHILDRPQAKPPTATRLLTEGRGDR